MNIKDYEKMFVDDFMARITNSCNHEKRQEAYRKVCQLLSSILDDSATITTFGSGPLKTYLPESDIDITILFTDCFLKGETLDTPSSIGAKELACLKEIMESYAEEYNIEDIQIINASVKIIKMQCDKIPIDISF